MTAVREIVNKTADVLLMPETTYAELPTGDQRWLVWLLGKYGRSLHTIPSQRKAAKVMQRREVTKEDLKWRVRFTWEPLNGLQHPKYSYSEAENEDRAIDMGVAALDRHKGNNELRLVEVHHKHVDADQWLKLE